MAAIPKMTLSGVIRDMWEMIYFQKIATYRPNPRPQTAKTKSNQGTESLTALFLWGTLRKRLANTRPKKKPRYCSGQIVKLSMLGIPSMKTIPVRGTKDSRPLWNTPTRPLGCLYRGSSSDILFFLKISA
jgi:hypothetical protein